MHKGNTWGDAKPPCIGQSVQCFLAIALEVKLATGEVAGSSCGRMALQLRRRLVVSSKPENAWNLQAAYAKSVLMLIATS